jgi:GxxExxY protein
MTGLIFEEERYAIRGAAFEVYKEMGCGFLEAVYQECLEKELQRRDIPYRSQAELAIHYKGSFLMQSYRPDLVCYESIVVELKAVKGIAAEHKAQLLNYLKASGLRLGFVINFGSYPKVQIERMVL